MTLLFDLSPRASAIYVNGTFGGVAHLGQTDDLLLARDANGYWTGFVAQAQEGDLYNFWVVGAGSSGYKRDPYAREMATDQPFPICCCLIRSSGAYPWHDGQFVTPDFSNMIIYQLHIGTYAPSAPGKASTFLDVIGKIEYLAALGINVLQPLPVDEMETNVSMGYNGADLFSPDFPVVVTDPNALNGYLGNINRMLGNKGCAPLSFNDISTGPAQLKAIVEHRPRLHVQALAEPRERIGERERIVLHAELERGVEALDLLRVGPQLADLVGDAPLELSVERRERALTLDELARLRFERELGAGLTDERAVREAEREHLEHDRGRAVEERVDELAQADPTCLGAGGEEGQNFGVEMHRRPQHRVATMKLAALGFGEIVFVSHDSSRYCRAATARRSRSTSRR